MSPSMPEDKFAEHPAPAHRPWCLPEAHHRDTGTQRCVSTVLWSTPDVCCWLIQDEVGPRVVLELEATSAELEADAATRLGADLLLLAGLTG